MTVAEYKTYLQYRKHRRFYGKRINKTRNTCFTRSLLTKSHVYLNAPMNPRRVASHNEKIEL